jgi:C4-dicarboxylate-specific signal transduction histidine kinase
MFHHFPPFGLYQYAELSALRRQMVNQTSTSGFERIPRIKDCSDGARHQLYNVYRVIDLPVRRDLMNILSRISSRISATLRSGQRDEYTSALNQRIWITNIFALSLGTAIAPYTIIFPLAGAELLGLLCVPQVIFYYMVPFFNRRGWIYFSRVSFGVLAHIILFSFAVALGARANIQMLFGLTISYGVLFYTRRERPFQILAVGLSLSSTLLFILYKNIDGRTFVTLGDTALTWIGGLVALTTLCLLFLISWYFHLSTQHAEDALQKHLNQLEQIVEERTAELRQHQTILLSVFESIDAGIAILKIDATLSHCNRRFAQIMGCDKTDVPTDDPDALREVYTRMIEHPETDLPKFEAISREGRKTEGTSRLRNGTIIEYYARPLIVKGERIGQLWMLRDVTRRRQMDELLIHSEKMISVGGMSAGIAHEINNPLAGILQSAQVVKNRLFDDTEKNRAAARISGVSWENLRLFLADRRIEDLLNNINASGMRASRIVANLLSFARKSDEAPSRCDIPALIESSLEFAGVDFNLEGGFDFQRIQIRKQIDPDLPGVSGFADKLQQVFINILRNGAHAMAENRTPAPRFIISAQSTEDGRVRIQFNNNGSQIPEDTRRRVFEPFFTTKKVGQGTGLGLSVSYFIVTEEHGGEMFVESSSEGGTTFTVLIPVSPVRKSRLPAPFYN